MANYFLTILDVVRTIIPLPPRPIPRTSSLKLSMYRSPPRTRTSSTYSGAHGWTPVRKTVASKTKPPSIYVDLTLDDDSDDECLNVPKKSNSGKQMLFSTVHRSQSAAVMHPKPPLSIVSSSSSDEDESSSEEAEIMDSLLPKDADEESKEDEIVSIIWGGRLAGINFTKES